MKGKNMTRTYIITAESVGENTTGILERANSGKAAEQAADWHRANGQPKASVSIVDDATGAIISKNWY